MQKKTIIKILERVKDFSRQKYKVEIKGIFGSYVRQEAKRNSDIDILVDFYKDADLLDLSGLSLFLEKELKRRVDVVPLSSLRKEIRPNVLREAIYL
ncbi:MAG: nucleotidyltransferase domain-containing protein [Candidatus Omnitrophota bacterium]|jgi:uncharacterized protein|nr:nucleotidyltransferase domain-containing protein [Candidatus Omnitrophota bacterium]